MTGLFHGMEIKDEIELQFLIEWNKINPKSMEFIIDAPKFRGQVQLQQGYVIGMNLSDFSAHFLPLTLAGFQKLEFLDLSHNHLTTVPNGIFSNQNIRTLILSHNELKQLPSEIKNLLNLESLILDHNKLQSLPPELEFLKKLTYLSLAENNISIISSLPSHFKEILRYRYHNLMEYGLSSQELDFLGELEILCSKPADPSYSPYFFAFTIENGHIISLDLSDQRLSVLPIATFQFPLRNLNLSHNKLIMLPKEIKKLTSLVEIIIDSEYLTIFPEEIAQLPALRYINDWEIPIELNRVSFSEKAGIMHLHSLGVHLEYTIEDNTITSLRLSIGDSQDNLPFDHFDQFPHLKHLQITHFWLPKPPKSLQYLHNLETLELDDLNLQEFPKIIFNLPRIRNLSLSNNHIESIPPEITRHSIEKLRISSLSYKECAILIQLDNLSELNGLEISSALGNLDPSEKHILFYFQLHQILQDFLIEKNHVIYLSLQQQNQHVNQLDLDHIFNEITWDIIPGFPQLHKLDLYDFNLRIIPEKIFQFLSLVELHIINCGLVHVPLEIKNLHQLSILDLSENKLRKIPQEIKYLSQIRELILRSNNFSKIPQELFGLNTLELLNLSENHILRVSNLINNLRSLRVLKASNNGMRKIVTLTNPKLIELDLSENQLNSLKIQKGGLKGMRSINLSMNRLKRFPHDLLKCQFLEDLQLDQNEISEIPIEIDQLHRLLHLNLGANIIRQLPTSIGSLVFLNSLYLTDNFLIDLPESIKKLSHLEILLLDGNKITEIPIWLGELPMLREVNLYDLPLNTYFHQFIYDPDEELTASNCKRLSRLIPTVIYKIKNNQSLDPFESNFPNYDRFRVLLEPICQEYPNTVAQLILKLLNAAENSRGKILL